MTKPLAVVAVGGNALIRDDQHMALADQYDAVCATATHVATMIAAGWNVVLTHGNGPQVGFILRRSEIADGQVPTVPVQYAVGDTQGAIGFMFQNALGNALLRRGIRVPTVTLVTQTLVDRRDPAFARPDKPIGSFMSEEVAQQLAAELGWTVMRDGDRGWRRSIASPQPVRVIEAPIIERLAREGTLIIACGGGGIAVEELAGGDVLVAHRLVLLVLDQRVAADGDDRAPPAHRSPPSVNPPIVSAIRALPVCMRFSASSKTTDCGPSMTSSVTSRPRSAGRQCM